MDATQQQNNSTTPSLDDLNTNNVPTASDAISADQNSVDDDAFDETAAATTAAATTAASTANSNNTQEQQQQSEEESDESEEDDDDDYVRPPRQRTAAASAAAAAAVPQARRRITRKRRKSNQRCPNGTRKRGVDVATGNKICKEKEEIEANRKRCKNGYRKNKDGNCVEFCKGTGSSTTKRLLKQKDDIIRQKDISIKKRDDYIKSLKIKVKEMESANKILVNDNLKNEKELEICRNILDAQGDSDLGESDDDEEAQAPVQPSQGRNLGNDVRNMFRSNNSAKAAQSKMGGPR